MRGVTREPHPAPLLISRIITHDLRISRAIPCRLD